MTDQATAEKLQLSNIHYNPERAGFEALVTVHHRGLTFRYPSYIPAPLHADFKLIAHGLSKRALAAHRSNKPGLRAWLRPLVAPMTGTPAMPLAA
ncbi:hypothetical protein U5922_017395 [Aquicoccus sp. G2-2]|uniref:hypothetical protein n=1 Tax=Aquicoccus sp. G2-2 TaxID=3092120 RepID=UPI002AE057D1|nr:hypothetical protein [Aquicoccus sp. G2-2]MEA1115156.1 hypothetical protein [Aquicoccus sp. G2-2]